MTKLKQTFIVELPEEWEFLKIIDLFEVKTGTTPPTKQKEFWENGDVNWITPADLNKVNGKIYIKKSHRKITDKALRDTNLNLLPKGSIILSTRAPVGYVNVLSKPSTFNQGCKGLLSRDIRTVNTEFYYYYLLTQKTYLENLSSGSTFKELSKDRLKNFHIPLPPFPEQKKIAEILSTVDDAIQKVGDAIAKTERLKKGLMQELLTNGIGHEKFKDSKVGRIPEEWEATNLGEVSTDFISGGTPSTKNPKYWNGNIPWMTSAHINGRTIATGMKNITEEGLNNSASNVVPKNSILLATRVGIGKVAINLVDIAISQDLTGIVPNTKKIDHEFVCWFITSNPNKLKARAQGSTIKGLLRTGIEKLDIPLPPLPEQKKIAEILSTVDKKLDLEKQRKEKLERIKRGLMNDLLTGRKRVKGTSRLII
ncbi:type-1 restriction enzyme EcoKI specificity protein [archaeon BMS3Bbin15]|nr:type-1 restriction enzyme EcoKI specificity protein [archaeon BMS3Bbin15]